MGEEFMPNSMVLHPYFDQVRSYLTVYDRGKQPFQYHRNAKPRKIPPAPGVVIRKQAWQQVVPLPENLLVRGRDEKTMLAGEDAEVMFRIQNTQWEVWHNPDMEVWHHIYPHRLEQAYLLKLARGYGTYPIISFAYPATPPGSTLSCNC
uniref:Uncharacterized protein n=1 Tax=Desertifilum tharense IPPAS B-1220 TaxID=1781255 RepID=A0ACD5GZ19_9CYAN